MDGMRYWVLALLALGLISSSVVSGVQVRTEADDNEIERLIEGDASGFSELEVGAQAGNEIERPRFGGVFNTIKKVFSHPAPKRPNVVAKPSVAVKPSPIVSRVASPAPRVISSIGSSVASAASSAGSAVSNIASSTISRIRGSIRKLPNLRNPSTPQPVSSPPPANAPDWWNKAQDCIISQKVCKKYGAKWTGTFSDKPPTSAGWSWWQYWQCFRRAQAFHDWCDNPPREITTATWKASGAVYTYQKFSASELVQLSVQHNIDALCADPTEKSTTIFYGKICANGQAVEWQWAKTIDPRPGMTEAQCTWRRNLKNGESWINAWLGTCTARPWAVYPIPHHEVAWLKGLKREWLGAGDKTYLIMKHSSEAMCGKAQKDGGSTAVFYGTVCEDGASVKWEKIQTLDPKAGMNVAQCTFSPGTDDTLNAAMFGTCQTPPSNVPALTSSSIQLIAGLKRGWFIPTDEVYLYVSNNLQELCSKTPTAADATAASRSLWYGKVCANGLIQWSSVATEDPREGMQAANCKFNADTLATKDAASLALFQKNYFGNCEKGEAPLMVPKLASMDPADFSDLEKDANACLGNPCDKNAVCARKFPSSFTCTCVNGYEGNGLPGQCKEIDACVKYKPCDVNAKCTKTGPGTYTCECNQNYYGNGKVCNEVNMCLSNPCHIFGTCTHTGPALYTCACKDGYEGDGKTKCDEIDNCHADVNPCHKKATCTKTGPGKHECTCIKGYQGDGTFSCTEIDPCASANPCGANGICSKSGPGQYVCTCMPGYRKKAATVVPPPSDATPGQPNQPVVSVNMDNAQCEEINPCDSSPCSANAFCAKLGPGMHQCTCKEGYTGDGVNCEEIDNCKTRNPCQGHSTCTKTGPGTHKCTCNDGYAGDGISCEEIDPCVSNPCDPHATCTKIGPGKHVCQCQKGYRPKQEINKAEGVMTCEEIDPCTMTAISCGKDAVCQKTGPGTHQCVCSPGFKGDGYTCVEINPCEQLPPPCKAHTLCKHTGPGAFECKCKTGYSGDPEHCTEADPCASNPCDKHAICAKTGPGTFTCTCGDGYMMKGTHCEEVDACISHPCDPHAICSKTGPGTYQCTCQKGYEGAGDYCVEQDPCTSNPCDSNSYCIKNGPMSYRCQCLQGYEPSLVTPNACTEIDMCQQQPCDPHATCAKTGPGTFSCTCMTGYVQRGKSCQEVDPCASNPCGVNTICEKTGTGSYACQCKPGYEYMSATRRLCVEVNACALKPCGPHSVCTKTGAGTYDCQCEPGYYGIVYQDAQIAAQQVSTNLVGGSTQAQVNPAAMALIPKVVVCQELDPCHPPTAPPNAVLVTSIPPGAPCDSNQRCVKTGPGTHTCLCKSGYAQQADGSCAEVDACLTGPCGPHAVCSKTGPGTFACLCKSGWVMRDRVCVEISELSADELAALGVTGDAGTAGLTKKDLERWQAAMLQAGFGASGPGKTSTPTSIEDMYYAWKAFMLKYHQLDSRREMIQKVQDLEERFEKFLAAMRLKQQEKLIEKTIGKGQGLRESEAAQFATDVRARMSQLEDNLALLAKMSQEANTRLNTLQSTRAAQEAAAERQKQIMNALLDAFRTSLTNAMSKTQQDAVTANQAAEAQATTGGSATNSPPFVGPTMPLTGKVVSADLKTTPLL